jgi:hypothetical protein
MKHIQVKYHFVHDLIENGKIKLVYQNTKDITADILTKPLSPTTHAFHAQRLGICTSRLEGEYWENQVLSGTSTMDGDSREGGEVQSGMGVARRGNDPIMAGGWDTAVRGRWNDEASSG